VVWGSPVGYLIGETTTLNVFVQRALADAALIGGVLGEEQTSARFRKAAIDLAHAINTVLWDETGGCYCAGYFSDEDMAANQAVNRKLGLPRNKNLTPSTLHANVFALDRGVVPENRRQRVLEKMLEQESGLKGGHVMIYYYVAKLLYGLDRATSDARVLELWRSNWPAMVESPWECSWESLGGGSHAHCYGMFPGYFLSTYVLGVRRDLPVADKKLLIEPHLGDLTQAAGVVVTEFGPVSVSWQKEGEHLQFQATVPANVECMLALPSRSGSESIQLDDKTLPGAVRGSRLIVPLSPGTHSGSY